MLVIFENLRLLTVVNLLISQPLNRPPKAMKKMSFSVGADYAAHALWLLFLFLSLQSFFEVVRMYSSLFLLSLHFLLC